MRQWLRAAILGSNDGLVSIAALMIGVSTAQVSNLVSITLAGIVAGAMSMAVGEYVSVRAEGTIRQSIEAAVASSLSYTAGGAIPLAGAFMPNKNLSIVAVTVAGLAIAGVLSGHEVKSKAPHIIRVILGGCVGMAITAGIGYLIR